MCWYSLPPLEFKKIYDMQWRQAYLFFHMSQNSFTSEAKIGDRKVIFIWYLTQDQVDKFS